MTTFTHQPSGRVLTVGRNPALGNRHNTDFQENYVPSDAGKLSVFDRKIPIQLMDLVFNELTLQEQADMEEFYRRALRGGRETFDLLTTPIIAVGWQVGMTLNGAVIQCGEQLKKDFDAAGELLQCGRYYRLMDEISLVDVRIQKGSWSATDGLRNGSTVSMTIIQELPLVL